LIKDDAISYLVDQKSRVHKNKKIWGGLTHQFDHDHHLLKFISFYSNNVRSKKKGIVYLDHCIFLHKQQLIKLGGVPDIDIFEDTVISEKNAQNFTPNHTALYC